MPISDVFKAFVETGFEGYVRSASSLISLSCLTSSDTSSFPPSSASSSSHASSKTRTRRFRKIMLVEGGGRGRRYSGS